MPGIRTLWSSAVPVAVRRDFSLSQTSCSAINYKKTGKELLYSSVMNSVAQNKGMNRDATSESIIHRHQASMGEVRYVRIEDNREDPSIPCCHRFGADPVDWDLSG